MSRSAQRIRWRPTTASARSFTSPATMVAKLSSREKPFEKPGRDEEHPRHEAGSRIFSPHRSIRARRSVRRSEQAERLLALPIHPVRWPGSGPRAIAHEVGNHLAVGPGLRGHPIRCLINERIEPSPILRRHRDPQRSTHPGRREQGMQRAKPPLLLRSPPAPSTITIHVPTPDEPCLRRRDPSRLHDLTLVTRVRTCQVATREIGRHDFRIIIHLPRFDSFSRPVGGKKSGCSKTGLKVACISASREYFCRIHSTKYFEFANLKNQLWLIRLDRLWLTSSLDDEELGKERPCPWILAMGLLPPPPWCMTLP